MKDSCSGGADLKPLIKVVQVPCVESLLEVRIVGWVGSPTLSDNNHSDHFSVPETLSLKSINIYSILSEVLDL